MIPGSFPRILNIESVSEFLLKDGDMVMVSVIKRLTGNKWAVGINGKVIPAFSEKNLIPGQKLRAYVVRQDDRVFLKCDVPRENTFSGFFAQQGLPDDAVSRAIVLSLIKTSLPLDPGVITRMRHQIEKSKKRPGVLARLLAVLHGKHIDISSSKIESLLELLSYGEDSREERDGKDREKNKKKKSFQNSGDIEAELKKTVSKTGEHNPLQVFNHIRGKNPDWLIIPFQFPGEKKPLSGTIRILFDFFTRKVNKMTLAIHQGPDIDIFFHVADDNTYKTCRIFCNNKKTRIQLSRKIKNLEQKLQNMDIKIDDSIYEGENFDGFTPLEELNRYRKINMYT